MDREDEAVQTTLERKRLCIEGTCKCEGKPYCAEPTCWRLAMGFAKAFNPDTQQHEPMGFCSTHLWED